MNKTWIKATAIRALKTMAEVMAAQLGAGGMGILEVDWIAIFSVTLMSGLLSVLWSIAGLPEVEATEIMGADFQTIYSEYGEPVEEEESEV